MTTHTLKQRVLVITMHDDPVIAMRAALLAQINDLVRGHKPASVVIVLDQLSPTQAALSVVLRAHHLCSHLGLVHNSHSTDDGSMRTGRPGSRSIRLGRLQHPDLARRTHSVPQRHEAVPRDARPPLQHGTECIGIATASGGSVWQRPAPARSEC